MCKRDNEPGHNTWPCVCLFYKRFWQVRINTNVSWCVFVCVCSRFNLTCKQFAATININKIWNYVEILWIYMEIAYASILFVCPFLFWLLCGAQKKHTHKTNWQQLQLCLNYSLFYWPFIYANSQRVFLNEI